MEVLLFAITWYTPIAVPVFARALCTSTGNPSTSCAWYIVGGSSYPTITWYIVIIRLDTLLGQKKEQQWGTLSKLLFNYIVTSKVKFSNVLGTIRITNNPQKYTEIPLRI